VSGRRRPAAVASWKVVGTDVAVIRGSLEVWGGIYRDLDAMPAFVGEFLAQDERCRVAALASGFRARGSAVRRLQAVLAHALHIRTWESLCVDGGLADDETVELMVAAVLAAVQAPATVATDTSRVRPA
jgi:hypothetical protein